MSSTLLPPEPAVIPPAAKFASFPAGRRMRPATAPVALTAAGCLTAFGDARTTTDALLRGESALRFLPVLANDGGDPVPLAVCTEWTSDLKEGAPRWSEKLFGLLDSIPDKPWGTARFPVFMTSSNFGIDNLYAYSRDGQEARLPYILPQRLTEFFCRRMGWGENITHFSHACVSSNLGLLYASRQIEAGLAEEALVVSYDFLSAFVAAGFHAMKILIGEMPAPYSERAFGSIGLGDGAAFAVLAPRKAARGSSPFWLEAQEGCNEMYHFTGNHPEGVGMAELGAAIQARSGGRPVWIKGHGTGTIEAGRLEAHHMAECFPGAPLVGWKGALGHTLGSCGLIEMAVAMESVRRGRAPGTIGASRPCYSEEVATESFNLDSYAGVVLNAYAFGGAHYAQLLCHD